MKNELYCLTPGFQDCCEKALDRLHAEVSSSIRLHEIIALPDYGGEAVLRLDYGSKPVKFLDQVDDLVRQARECVTPNFWVTLMGSCYAPFGFYPKVVDELGAILQEALPKRVPGLSSSVHSSEIVKDGVLIRAELGLSDAVTVWEIEVPVAERGVLPEIRVVQPEGALLATSTENLVGGKRCRISAIPPSPSYEGIMKAYVRSCELGIGLATYLMNVRREGVA